MPAKKTTKKAAPKASPARTKLTKPDYVPSKPRKDESRLVWSKDFLMVESYLPQALYILYKVPKDYQGHYSVGNTVVYAFKMTKAAEKAGIEYEANPGKCLIPAHEIPALMKALGVELTYRKVRG